MNEFENKMSQRLLHGVLAKIFMQVQFQRCNFYHFFQLEEKRRVAQEYRASKIPIPSGRKNIPSSRKFSVQAVSFHCFNYARE